jgi:hypothetical protein
MQFKTLVRYPIDIRRARRLMSARPRLISELAERPVALDLRTPHLLFDCGRHLASLAHHATCAGSPFYVRCRQLLLAAMARKIHGRDLLAMPQVSWIPQEEALPADAFVLTDYQPQPESDSVQMMIGRDIDRSIPVMPYPMHPATLHHNSHADIIRLRQPQKRPGILFAGNQKPKYGDAKMRRNFGVLSRLEILDTLTQRFSDRITRSMSAAAPKKDIVLCDSRSEPISTSDWLSALASAQFFVCCPGASQPTCHNLIEAMSVGAIPIIEYDDRLTPPLRDGENAICFRGQAGLIEAIERIARLAPEQISQLSENVAAYYDDHLCGTRFMRRMRDGQLDLISQRVCMPFHELNFYPQQRAAA